MATKKKPATDDGDASKPKQPTPKVSIEINATDNASSVIAQVASELNGPETMTIITRAGKTIEIEPADWPMWRLRSARKPDQDEPEVKRGTNNP